MNFISLPLRTRNPNKKITANIETKVSNRKIINRAADSLGLKAPAKILCRYQAIAAATPVSKRKRIPCIFISFI
jgi:hypothetical protein